MMANDTKAWRASANVAIHCQCIAAQFLSEHDLLLFEPYWGTPQTPAGRPYTPYVNAYGRSPGLSSLSTVGFLKASRRRGSCARAPSPSTPLAPCSPLLSCDALLPRLILLGHPHDSLPFSSSFHLFPTHLRLKGGARGKRRGCSRLRGHKTRAYTISEIPPVERGERPGHSPGTQSRGAAPCIPLFQ